MSNVRFLDNVSVSSYGSTATQAVGAAFPRVVFTGETKTVVTNINSYAFDVYNAGTINIRSGIGVDIGGTVAYSHGLLRVENLFTNQGTINISGIFEVGDSSTFADITVI
jgi:hypothetical protein